MSKTRPYKEMMQILSRNYDVGDAVLEALELSHKAAIAQAVKDDCKDLGFLVWHKITEQTPKENNTWYAVWHTKRNREMQLWWDGAIWIEEPSTSGSRCYGIGIISYWRENIPSPEVNRKV